MSFLTIRSSAHPLPPCARWYPRLASARTPHARGGPALSAAGRPQARAAGHGQDGGLESPLYGSQA